MLDLLEKGMREPDENDYMTAYSIEGHPEVHLSHHYFRNLNPDQIKNLTGLMQQHFGKKPLEAKTVGLQNQEMFGPEKDIRVLVNDELAPHLDPELKNKFNEIAPSKYPYRPHVTTNDKQAIQGRIKNFYFLRGNGQVLFATNAQKPELKKGLGMKVNAKVEGIEVKRPQGGMGTGIVNTGVATGMPATPKVGVPPKLSPMTGKMNNVAAPMAKAEPDPLKYGLPQVKQGDIIPPKMPPQAPGKLDYSEFNRPTYSTSGKNKPLHNPVQHSKGAMTGTEREIHKSEGLERARNVIARKSQSKLPVGKPQNPIMEKADDPKFERCVMDVKGQNKAEGKTQEQRNPWAICHASLGKAQDSGYEGIENPLVQDQQPMMKCDRGYMTKSVQLLRKCMASKMQKHEPGKMPVFMRD